MQETNARCVKSDSLTNNVRHLFWASVTKVGTGASTADADGLMPTFPKRSAVVGPVCNCSLA